ncbi:hypothetical protein OEZ86_009454 [Tetradesmus obliquus]|nr:hypothetical protein OEZ86_009454 [Tetradesmus obliquus]
MRQLNIGACTTRFRIEQLEAVLQQKKKKLAKLEHIRKVLTEREQVFTSCIDQQVDLLEVLGRLAFSLPDADDAAYEAKATLAVEALLKDMEVAQLMQAADSIPTSATAAMDHSIPAQTPQQQQQQELQQLAEKPQSFTTVTLRRFLQSAECMQTLRRMGSATVEELAGIIRDQTMQLGFAVARYPSKTYLGAAALAAADERQRSSMQAANARLHAALDALGTTNLLLHIVGDKVLQLSTLNLETLQPETPPASFWEDVAAKMDVPPPHMTQLHTGFLIYDAKRSQLTQQMQATMVKLQQLLKPLTQQQEELQQHLADKQQQSADALRSGGSKSSSSGHFSLNADDASASAQPGSDAAAPDMFECVEDADWLLLQLSRQVWCLREASRCFIFHFCNVLDPLQLSRSAVDAWPFIIQPPPVVEVLVKRQVARQQQEGTAIDDE